MIITKTPLRVSLFGGGTDLPNFADLYGGSIVSLSIDKYIYISCHPLVESNEILLKYSALERVTDPKDIQHKVFRFLLSKYALSGIDIAVSSDVPAGTGLGSSSSFTVGLLNTLQNYLKLPNNKLSLARAACDVEIDGLGEPIGVQDQYAAAFGGLNFLEIEKDRNVTVHPIVLNNSVRTMLKENLILARMPGTRSAGDILRLNSDPTQIHNRNTVLLEMKALASESLKFINAGPKALGELLHESWGLKRRISSNISNDQIDRAYAQFLRRGAYGGKLLGAGAAGYMLIIAEKDIIDEIAASHFSSIIRFSINESGSDVIFDSEVKLACDNI